MGERDATVRVVMLAAGHRRSATRHRRWRMWLNRRTDVWFLPAAYVAVNDAEEGAVASSLVVML
ncbi:hypothetical protein V1290_005297 [Bradyrhizobium sp. AZCC 1578]|uniref:hypothetical protein n=1 Tax=unclassified Bradyrhizobium TaxID=2631580 RepID=UPI002FF251B2